MALVLLSVPVIVLGITHRPVIDVSGDSMLYESTRKSILSSLDSGVIPKIMLDSSNTNYISYNNLYSHSLGLHSDIVFRLNKENWDLLRKLLYQTLDSASYIHSSYLESNCGSNFHCFRWAINRRLRYEELKASCKSSISTRDTWENHQRQKQLKGVYVTTVMVYPSRKFGEQAFVFNADGLCDIYYRKSKRDTFRYIETGIYKRSDSYLIIETVSFRSWTCIHQYIYFKTKIWGYKYHKRMLNDTEIYTNYKPFGALKRTWAKVNKDVIVRQ